MSILGNGGLPAIGLASSAAAGQQRPASLVDRDKVDQALQKLRADEAQLNERDLDDSIETEFSHGQVGDRDSDGRLPWQHPAGEGGSGESTEEVAEPPRARDPRDECGRMLDVDV